MRRLYVALRQHTRAALVATTLLLLLAVVLSLAGVIAWPQWTGFGAESGPTNGIHVSVVQYQRTLWDWLQLLGVPLAVAVAAWYLNMVQQRREERLANRRELDSVLDTYLTQIATLLLHEKLGNTSDAGKAAQHVARAQTLTVLRRLDGGRKATVVEFLSDSGLLPVVDLHGADLTGATRREGSDLTNARLSKANLSHASLVAADLALADLTWAILREAMMPRTSLAEAKLTWADLTEADLAKADLTSADLSHADLERTYLRGSRMQGAKLHLVRAEGARLRGADLSYADLNQADLTGVELSAANLTGANLAGALLCRADLRNACLADANLQGACLGEANLRGAIGTTKEQLERAESLLDTTLPDGTVVPCHPAAPTATQPDFHSYHCRDARQPDRRHHANDSRHGSGSSESPDTGPLAAVRGRPFMDTPTAESQARGGQPQTTDEQGPSKTPQS